MLALTNRYYCWAHSRTPSTFWHLKHLAERVDSGLGLVLEVGRCSKANSFIHSEHVLHGQELCDSSTRDQPSEAKLTSWHSYIGAALVAPPMAVLVPPIQERKAPSVDAAAQDPVSIQAKHVDPANCTEGSIWGCIHLSLVITKLRFDIITKAQQREDE